MTSRVPIKRLAQAMANRLLPVKSSAPATTTRTSPRLKLKPPNKRVTPKPKLALVITTVKKRAPSEMKAPARTARARSVTASVRAFATPSCSARRAISRGGCASTRGGGSIAIRPVNELSDHCINHREAELFRSESKTCWFFCGIWPRPPK